MLLNKREVCIGEMSNCSRFMDRATGKFHKPAIKERDHYSPIISFNGSFSYLGDTFSFLVNARAKGKQLLTFLAWPLEH